MRPTFLTILLLYLASGAHAAPEFIVTVHGTSGPAVRGFVESTLEGRVTTVYEHVLNGFAAELTPAAATALAADPRVRTVSPVKQMIASGTQSNPPWPLDRIDSRTRTFDWRYNYPGTGAGVNVYILDTGVSMHRQFTIHAAYDAVDGAAYDTADAVTDCKNHGTPVAGIIGGITYGVAKAARLHSVKIVQCLHQQFSPPVVNTNSGWTIRGLDWIAANHVKPAVVNMSWKADGVDPMMDEAVQNLINRGVMVVVAAGNGSDGPTARSPLVRDALMVGAVDHWDRRVANTEQGHLVDVFAPGWAIPTASADGGTTEFYYTSAATPFVTGLVALYLERHPNATPSEIHAFVVNSATPGAVTNISAAFETPNRLLYVPPVIP